MQYLPASSTELHVSTLCIVWELAWGNVKDGAEISVDGGGHTGD